MPHTPVKFNKSPFSSSFLWRTMAHCESQYNMFPCCHGFKEIGSIFVCREASIQPSHKGGETRSGLRESSLCGVEGKGWIEKKNCLGASVFSDPNWNYKCICEMSYQRRAMPQAGLFFPVSRWWVSRTWSDKADKKGLLSGGSLGNYNSLFGALQRCCGDKGDIMSKKGPVIMYLLNGSK